jgi:hypothetical protein
MKKIRYKIIINWQGENHEFYRLATSAPQALHLSIRGLAHKVGYSTKYVESMVMDSGARRWEVIEVINSQFNH